MKKDNSMVISVHGSDGIRWTRDSCTKSIKPCPIFWHRTWQLAIGIPLQRFLRRLLLTRLMFSSSGVAVLLFEQNKRRSILYSFPVWPPARQWTSVTSSKLSKLRATKHSPVFVPCARHFSLLRKKDLILSYFIFSFDDNPI